MADAVFALVIFYSFILGARRGFYKEVVQFVALVASVYVTQRVYDQAGARLAGSTGAPLVLANALAAVVVWVVSFFVIAVVGRLVLKKLRGKGVDDNLGEGAEALADALAGDTTKGPVTLLTDPIASKRGLFYWSDKLLGAGLGLVKGIITGYVLFGIVVYVDKLREWDWAFARSVEGSHAAAFFHDNVEPILADELPAYRIILGLEHMKAIAELVKQDPRRAVAFVEHPQVKALHSNPRVTELAHDPAIRAAWSQHDLPTLLRDEKVRALLADRDLRKAVAAVDWEKVHADVAAYQPTDGDVLRAVQDAVTDDGPEVPDPPGGR